MVHPPGHPVWLLLARLYAFLPLGSVPFRVALLSATCGALTVWLAARLAARLAASAGPVAQGLAAATAAFLAAGSTAMLGEATRPEVYALNAALVLFAVDRALSHLESGKPGDLAVAGVAAGLGLGNHHYLVVFAAPALFLAARHLRDLRGPMVTGGLALVAYAALPVRALTQPVINWGDPSTPGRFFDVLTAKTFQVSVSAETRGAPILDNLATALGMWADAAGPVTIAFGLSAAVLGLLRQTRVAAVLLALLAGSLATKVLMFIDPENPDDYGYFAVGITVTCALAAALPALLGLGSGGAASVSPTSGAAQGVVSAGTSRCGAVRWAVVTPLLLLGGGLGLPGRLEATQRSSDTSAATVGAELLEPLAPDAIAFVDYFQFYFQTWYAQLVEGVRPDAVVVQVSFDTRRGDASIRRWRAEAPALAPVLDAALTHPESFPRAEVLALATKRPVFLEVTLEDLVPAGRLESHGVLRRVVPSPTHESAARRLDAAAWERALPRRPGPDARRLVDLTHFNQAVLALRQGMPRLAEDSLTRWAQLGHTLPPEPLLSLAEALSEPGRPGAPERAAAFLAQLGTPLETATPSTVLAALRTLQAPDR